MSNPESELESGSASVLNEEVGFNWMLPLFGAVGFGIGFALTGAIMFTIYNLAQNAFANTFPGTGVGSEVGIPRGLTVGAIGGAALGLAFKDKTLAFFSHLLVLSDLPSHLRS